MICSRSLRRRENEADIRGWRVRVVWEDGGRRGIVYLHRNARDRTPIDERTFIFPSLDPRREARILFERLDRRTATEPPRRGMSV